MVNKIQTATFALKILNYELQCGLIPLKSISKTTFCPNSETVSRGNDHI